MKELIKKIWCFITLTTYVAPEPPPVPRKFTLPADKVKEFLALYDVFVAIDSDKGNRVAKYNMWEFLAVHIPETSEPNIDWRVNITDAVTVVVTELFPR